MSTRVLRRAGATISTIVLLATCLPGIQCRSVSGHGRDADAETLWPERVPEGPIDFGRHVKPLLEDQCLECHNPVDAADFAGLNLETRAAALRSGRSAPVIVPGEPDRSLLIQVLKLDPRHPQSMPAAPEKVAGVRLAILEKWIAEGAPWPERIRLVRPQDAP